MGRVVASLVLRQIMYELVLEYELVCIIKAKFQFQKSVATIR